MERSQKKKNKVLLIVITILICISSITTINFFGRRSSVKEVQAIPTHTYKNFEEKNNTENVQKDIKKELLEEFKEFDLNFGNNDEITEKDNNLLEEVKKYIEDIKKIEIIKELKITFNKIGVNVREFFQFVDEFF